MSGGDWIGTGSCGDKEMDTAARVCDGVMGRVVGNKRSNRQSVRKKIYFSCSLYISYGRFIYFAGATFAFGTCCIMLVPSYWFRASLAGVITALSKIPAVVVAVGADETRGRELALIIGDAGL